MTTTPSETRLQGLILLTPQRFEDSRGWFLESWNAERFRELGLNVEFVQDNHSYSQRKGTLRGLHYQSPPRAQDKLVRCVRGSILDVAVDVRMGSPSYGQWFTVELTSANQLQLFIPKGFLHGFLTLTPDTEVQYKCSDSYAPNCDGAVRWDSVGIDWGSEILAPELSEKDASAPRFVEFTSPFTYGAFK